MSGTYYHATPEDNVEGILSRGLQPHGADSHVWGDYIDVADGVVFLADSIVAAENWGSEIAQAVQRADDPEYDPDAEVENYIPGPFDDEPWMPSHFYQPIAILEVKVPDGVEVEEHYHPDGKEIIVHGSIPPENIRLVKTFSMAQSPERFGFYVEAGLNDDPETQKALEDLADAILSSPTRVAPFNPADYYGGTIQQGRGEILLNGQRPRVLYRVVDPGEWADAQAKGYVQSRGGYTRASAKPDERWRYQGEAGVRGITLEIDYDPADEWTASAEGYAATWNKIPLSRVRVVDSQSLGARTAANIDKRLRKVQPEEAQVAVLDAAEDALRSRGHDPVAWRPTSKGSNEWGWYTRCGNCGNKYETSAMAYIQDQYEIDDEGKFHRIWDNYATVPGPDPRLREMGRGKEVTMCNPQPRILWRGYHLPKQEHIDPYGIVDMLSSNDLGRSWTTYPDVAKGYAKQRINNLMFSRPGEEFEYDPEGEFDWLPVVVTAEFWWMDQRANYKPVGFVTLPEYEGEAEVYLAAGEVVRIKFIDVWENGQWVTYPVSGVKAKTSAKTASASDPEHIGELKKYDLKRQLSDREVEAKARKVIDAIAARMGVDLSDVEIIWDEYLDGDARYSDANSGWGLGRAIRLNPDTVLARLKDPEYGVEGFRQISHETMHACSGAPWVYEGQVGHDIEEGGAEILSVCHWDQHGQPFDKRDAFREPGRGWVEGREALIHLSVYKDKVDAVIRRAASKVGWNAQAILSEVERVFKSDDRWKWGEETDPTYPLPPGVYGEDGALTWLVENLSGRTASRRTASSGTIYRGLRIEAPQDLLDRIEALLQPPLEEDQIDQQYQIGPMILDYLQQGYYDGFGDVGLGRHWTTDREMALGATTHGNIGGNIGVLLTATYTDADVDPEPTGTTDAWRVSEFEVTILPGARLNVTQVEIESGGLAYHLEPVLQAPLHATATADNEVRDVWRGLFFDSAPWWAVEAWEQNRLSSSDLQRLGVNLNDNVGPFWAWDRGMSIEYALQGDEDWAYQTWTEDQHSSQEAADNQAIWDRLWDLANQPWQEGPAEANLRQLVEMGVANADAVEDEITNRRVEFEDKQRQQRDRLRNQEPDHRSYWDKNTDEVGYWAVMIHGRITGMKGWVPDVGQTDPGHWAHGWDMVVLEGAPVEIVSVEVSMDGTTWKPVAGTQGLRVTAEAHTAKTYYHGFGRGSRLSTGDPAWDDLFFVSHDPEVAHLYGDTVRRVEVDPSAKVKVIDGYNKTGKTPSQLVEEARAEGYDVVEFYHPHDFIGHVILNEGVILSGGPGHDDEGIMYPPGSMGATAAAYEESGTWDDSSGEMRWIQPHEDLVKGAMQSWVGWPDDMSIHMQDELDGAPQPRSGSGKIMRAQARALLIEFRERGRTNNVPLYRGTNFDTTLTRWGSWSERKAVASLWAKRLRGDGQVLTLEAGQGFGLRVEDYIRPQIDETEQQWIIVSDQVRAQLSRVAAMIPGDVAGWLHPDGTFEEVDEHRNYTEHFHAGCVRLIVGGGAISMEKESLIPMTEAQVRYLLSLWKDEEWPSAYIDIAAVDEADNHPPVSSFAITDPIAYARAIREMAAGQTPTGLNNLMAPRLSSTDITHWDYSRVEEIQAAGVTEGQPIFRGMVIRKQDSFEGILSAVQRGDRVGGHWSTEFSTAEFFARSEGSNPRAALVERGLMGVVLETSGWVWQDIEEHATHSGGFVAFEHEHEVPLQAWIDLRIDAVWVYEDSGWVRHTAGIWSFASIDRSRLGQCYVLSGRYVVDHADEDIMLIHGSIQGFDNPRIGHAWVELANGKVWEPASDQEWDGPVFAAMFHPEVNEAYTPDEVLALTVRTGHWGPWDEIQTTASGSRRILYHGTKAQHIESIMSEGLRAGQGLLYPGMPLFVCDSPQDRAIVSAIGTPEGPIVAFWVDEDRLFRVDDYDFEGTFRIEGDIPSSDIIGARWYDYDRSDGQYPHMACYRNVAAPGRPVVREHIGYGWASELDPGFYDIAGIVAQS